MTPTPPQRASNTVISGTAMPARSMSLASVLMTCLIVCTAVLSPRSLLAQEPYPSRPIHLLVGFPPGGQSDIMARVIGDALAKQLKQAVVVENRAGGSGIVAAQFVSKQLADGYTLMVTSESVQSRSAAVYKKLPYDPLSDFTMIAKVAKQKTLMVVNVDSKLTTVKDFIAFAKTNPGKLNYGAAYSTSSQFGGALFGMLNGVDLVAVNYPGGAKPMTDLLGNVVDVGFFIESTVEQMIKAGRLRPLAVISETRSDLFPDVPTMRQAGAAPMEVTPWFGVVGPAKMPASVVADISEALKTAAADPEFQAQLQKIGATSIGDSTPDGFTADIRNEMSYWKNFVAETKFPLMD